MKTFWIIAAVLTAAYVFYYAVMICIDLYRKPGGENKPEEETFELKNPVPATGRVVEVTDRGFSVAGGDRPVVESVMPAVKTPPDSGPADAPPAPKLDASGAPVTSAGRKVLSAREDMEEIDPACSGEMTHQMLSECMGSGGSTVPLDRTVTPPGQPAASQNGPGHDAGKRV